MKMMMMLMMMVMIERMKFTTYVFEPYYAVGSVLSYDLYTYPLISFSIFII